MSYGLTQITWVRITLVIVFLLMHRSRLLVNLRGERKRRTVSNVVLNIHHAERMVSKYLTFATFQRLPVNFLPLSSYIFPLPPTLSASVTKILHLRLERRLRVTIN